MHSNDDNSKYYMSINDEGNIEMIIITVMKLHVQHINRNSFNGSDDKK